MEGRIFPNRDPLFTIYIDGYGCIMASAIIHVSLTFDRRDYEERDPDIAKIAQLEAEKLFQNFLEKYGILGTIVHSIYDI